MILIKLDIFLESALKYNSGIMIVVKSVSVCLSLLSLISESEVLGKHEFLEIVSETFVLRAV